MYSRRGGGRQRRGIWSLVNFSLQMPDLGDVVAGQMNANSPPPQRSKTYRLLSNIWAYSSKSWIPAWSRKKFFHLREHIFTWVNQVYLKLLENIWITMIKVPHLPVYACPYHLSSLPPSWNESTCALPTILWTQQIVESRPLLYASYAPKSKDRNSCSTPLRLYIDICIRGESFLDSKLGHEKLCFASGQFFKSMRLFSLFIIFYKAVYANNSLTLDTGCMWQNLWFRQTSIIFVPKLNDNYAVWKKQGKFQGFLEFCFDFENNDFSKNNEINHAAVFDPRG